MVTGLKLNPTDAVNVICYKPTEHQVQLRLDLDV